MQVTLSDFTAEQDQDRGEFAALGISPDIARTLAALGYEEPTPIQKQTIPPLLEGRDVVGQAATGTGKTAAFALPIVERLARSDRSGRDTRVVTSLILVPTRELAIQVAEAIHKYGKSVGARVLPIYGGQSIHQQLVALRRGVDVAVATPGRALDHIRRKTLDLSRVNTVVLDEADEMLDMGFAEDLEAILDAASTERQTALFSATLAPRIRTLAKKHLKDPVSVRVEAAKEKKGDVPKVRQVAYMVQRQQKAAALGRILDMESPASAIIFCRTRTEVDELTETLNARGYRSEAIHGGLSQEQRDRVMRRFRDRALDLLVATDVAARGLDIGHLSHVVNFDVPPATDAYVHRIGRTGRAGREGTAITLAEPRESRLLRNIEQHIGRKITIEKVPSIRDLQARQLEKTTLALREAIEGGDLDEFRSVVETLGEEFDVSDVAAAAVKLAHAATGSADRDDEEIKNVAAAPERPEYERKKKSSGKKNRFDDDHRSARGEKMVRIHLSLGRQSGIRPADLVGAIANEAGISGKDIGSIEMNNGFALVEIPERSVDTVVEAMSRAKVRGKRLAVRRDRQGSEKPMGRKGKRK
ncbi:MAG TPA: DEAD/DEAH box helicase [Gemmatimonadaceae bacterium]